jgi:hypothetical protein
MGGEPKSWFDYGHHDGKNGVHYPPAVKYGAGALAEYENGHSRGSGVRFAHSSPGDDSLIKDLMASPHRLSSLLLVPR